MHTDRLDRNGNSSWLLESLEARAHLAADVTINAGDRAQVIEGFGTSLGGYTPIQLVKSKKLQKLYYQDLGSSIFRVQMNFSILKDKSGDLATPVYLGQSLQKNIAQFDFGQKSIAQFGTFARAAMKYKLDDIKLIGSIWSPPQWMKGPELNPYTGKPNGVMPKLDYTTYGAVNASGGSLIDTDANLTQFGRYVAAYVKGFEQAYGVPLYAISIQNELAFHEPYHSCVYTPELYVHAVKAVSRWFRKYHITTKLLGPEDVGVGSTTDPYVLSRQMDYIKALRKDPESAAAIWGYAIHGYASNGFTSQRSPKMWDQYWSGRKGNPGWKGIALDDKQSWMTEISGGSQKWASGLRLAQSIQDALVYGNANAWVYWGITSSSTTATSEGLAVGTDSRSSKYVATKHFSRFIRPGAVRLKTSSINPTGLYASAFVHDADRTLTTVLINGNDKPETVRLHLPGINIDAFTTGYLSTPDSSWIKLKNLQLTDGTAKITLPAGSILTLQGDVMRKRVSQNVAAQTQSVSALAQPMVKSIFSEQLISFLDDQKLKSRVL